MGWGGEGRANESEPTLGGWAVGGGGAFARGRTGGRKNRAGLGRRELPVGHPAGALIRKCTLSSEGCQRLRSLGKERDNQVAVRSRVGPIPRRGFEA